MRRAPTRRSTLGALAAAALLAACEGAQNVQSALHPAGPQAARIERLWWPMLWILAGAWVLTMIALAFALAHRRKARKEVGPRAIETTGREPFPETGDGTLTEEERREERRIGVVVATAAAVCTVILIGLLVAYFSTGAAMTHLFRSKAIIVDVTGHQWWWQVDYRAQTPSDRVTTANEIHIPVGEPVMIFLRSNDVIHSFWVPNLHGKRDLIPGHETSIWIQADKPGAYRGECAEFCGMQHAKMALWVIAEPRDQFDAWYRGQLAAAAPPADSVRERGEEVFIARSCIMCHSIRGTPAGGKTGPDLTHLASRRTIGAGSLPNTPGNLGGWIVDPQSIKPGVKMPSNGISPDELEALLAYLGGLE